jgi:uncharacterized membrane protein YfcA
MTTRVLLASPLGFLIGVSLGALGGGGSILAVPVLVFVAGQDPAAATTTSLVIVGVASIVGAVGHWRHGRVRLRSGIVFGLVGLVGSIGGSAVNRRLDGDVLLLGFAGLILVAAWRVVAGCPSCSRVGERREVTDPPTDLGGRGAGAATRAERTTGARVTTLAVAGTAVGFLTGLFGVGGGFVIVPALALVLRYPMPQAIGTSLVVIAVNTAAALAVRLGASVDWGSTILFTAAATAGVGAGSSIADRVEPASLQRSFAALLVAVALYTGGRAAAGIW